MSSVYNKCSKREVLSLPSELISSNFTLLGVFNGLPTDIGWNDVIDLGKMTIDTVILSPAMSARPNIYD